MFPRGLFSSSDNDTEEYKVEVVDIYADDESFEKHEMTDNHYNKTRLLQLGFSTFTSEKTRILLPWKTTSRFRQAVKYGRSHVGQNVPNGSEVWDALCTLLHKVMSYFTMSRQYR